MKVILIYDISVETEGGQRRLTRVLKKARKYLHHVQKSVFEGELTAAQLRRLEVEILDEVDRHTDSVIIYTLPDAAKLGRKILTEVEDPTANIL